jgi:GxxExxY protein
VVNSFGQKRTTKSHKDTKGTKGMNKDFPPISSDVELVAAEIVDSALKVHQALGPGLLESIYESCLCHELSKRNVAFERQRCWPVVYDGLRLESGLRADLFVDNCVIVELKAVDQHNPLFESQLLSYLKLADVRLGLLINFNVPLLKHGIRRIVR